MGKRRELAKFSQSVFQQGKSRRQRGHGDRRRYRGRDARQATRAGRCERLKLIEVNEERAAEIAGQLDCMVLHGDGSDLALLRQENIAESDVLVSVTSDDEKNLLGSLLAKQMGIPKIITRVDKAANIRLFESVGIDVPLNARITAVLAVQNMLRGTSAELLATLEQGLAQVLEIVVPEDYPVTKVRKLPPVPGAIIGAVVRGRRTIVPHGDDYVKPGDHLLVVSTEDSKAAVEQVLSSGAPALPGPPGTQMRLAVVAHIIGLILRLFGALLIAPLVVDLIYGNREAGAGVRHRRRQRRRSSARACADSIAADPSFRGVEGLAVVAFSWFVVSLFRRHTLHVEWLELRRRGLRVDVRADHHRGHDLP